MQMSGQKPMGEADRSAIKRSMLEIIGLSHQLSFDLEQSESYDQIDIVERVVGCCYKVLAQIINAEKFEKLDSYYPEKVNLGSLLEDLVAICRSKLRGTNITITCDCEDDIAVVADVGGLVASVMNLIVNAAQNVSTEDGVIKVRAERLSESAMVYVSDNGYGVETDDLSQLTEPGDHVGGLAVVKKFCEKSGTSLLISADYCGFMASFRLPLAPPDSMELKSWRANVLNGTFSDVNIYLSKLDELQ